MKGLIQKDMYNLKDQGKLILFMLIIWFFFGLTNKDFSFFAGMCCMFGAMLPITALAYDERAKWDKYALSMPVTKLELVGSKYLFALLIIGLGGLVSCIPYLLGLDTTTNSLKIPLTVIGAALLFEAIILPCLFKFGVEKGRLMMIMIFLLPTILVLLLKNMNIPMPSEQTIMTLFSLVPLIGILSFVLSLGISYLIYKNRELE